MFGIKKLKEKVRSLEKVIGKLFPHENFDYKNVYNDYSLHITSKYKECRV